MEYGISKAEHGMNAIPFSSPIRCLIVDDERLARVSLRALLASHPCIRVVAEADDVRTAVRAVRAHKPDLIFLDIQMPGGSGFDLLAKLEYPPPVIFVTAYDLYAIRAFEVNALDYLLKPVDPGRLDASLRRISAVKTSARCRGADSKAPLRMDDHVLLDSGRRCVAVPVEDILTIHADGNYTRVVLRDRSEHLVRVAFNTWATRLPDGFVAISRSILIQAAAVTVWESRGRGLVLRFGSTGYLLELSRTAADRFRGWLKGSLADS